MCLYGQACEASTLMVFAISNHIMSIARNRDRYSHRPKSESRPKRCTQLPSTEALVWVWQAPAAPCDWQSTKLEILVSGLSASATRIIWARQGIFLIWPLGKA